VPWRFLDAGQLSVLSVSSLPASKNLHKSRPKADANFRRLATARDQIAQASSLL
jgi:hypothetical protein